MCFLRRCAGLGLLLGWLGLAVVPPARADVVTDWNTIIGQTIRADSTQPGPTFASRNYAMVQAAVFDAVNSVGHEYQPYRYSVSAPAGTSREAAAVQSAYRVLSGLYPLQAANLAAARDASLAGLPDAGKADGISVGDYVGQSMLDWRATDHAHDPVSYTPGVLPGMFRLQPGQANALGPGWGLVTPFAISSAADFRSPAPPALNSPEYTTAFEEVKRLGSIDAEALGFRTPDQTEIGIFWGYDRGGLGPPPILYNQIAQHIAVQQGNTLLDNARMFALMNIAQADAGIQCWDTKYYYNLWRPVGGIREAGTDGNPATEADPNWTPLGAPDIDGPPGFTPPFPAYSSGHATFGAAALHSLANFYDDDDIAFTIGSDELPGVYRSYASFSEAIEENGQSRIYLGIHWSFDKTAGIEAGLGIADFVFNNCMRATIPEPSTWALACVGGVGLLMAARRRRRAAG